MPLRAPRPLHCHHDHRRSCTRARLRSSRRDSKADVVACDGAGREAMHWRSAAAAAVTALAIGCGGRGGGAPITVKGQSFTPKDTISSQLSGVGAIVIGNYSGLCTYAAANQTPRNLSGLIILVYDYNISSGVATAPKAPGTYTVVTTGIVKDKMAVVAYEVTDANCQDVLAKDASSVSGTVTLTDVSNSAYSGSYDVIMDSSDHLSGSFSATACSAIRSLFGTPGSNATCI